MSNSEYTLVSFASAFAGAAFSLLLWFGTDACVRWKRSKKIRKALMQEIAEELRFNIEYLKVIPTTLQQSLDSGVIPLRIVKLHNSSSNYAISSGEIRLMPSIRKQRLIRLASMACETFNGFIDNTERLLAIFMLKQDGATLAKYRINQLIELASEVKSLLEDYLNKLQQKDLPDEYVKERQSGNE